MSSDPHPSSTDDRELDPQRTLHAAEPSLEGERVLAEVMTGLFGSDAAAPVRIGRFVVLRRLGAGAMGEVYAAYDAELDRRVAIKLLLAGPVGGTSRDEDRLRREAKAIARLAHPNVVPVFEVGQDRGRLFIVMELVEGTTLRAWLHEHGRRRDEILDMFEQAGRGLEAAHSAGVVHRDLKPDNILVGHDGRARLVDFGLARTGALPSDPGTEDTAPAHESVIAGTPRYMAPEQFAGSAVDHRADQFAFCVSLWEALYGVPPFGGRSMREVAMKVIERQIDPPPADRKVPAAITRILLRGLARDPDDRFASITELIAELRRARAVPRRRAFVGVLAVATCAGLVALAIRQQGIHACREEASAATAAWASAREPVHAAFVATELPYAEHTLQRIASELDAWSSQWAEARRASCLARDDDPNGMAARQDMCLDDRRAELDALLHVFSNADREVVSSAASAVASLPAVQTCTDAARLAALPLPTEEQRATIDALRPDIAELDALSAAGRYADALAIGRRILPEVERCGHPPVHTEMLRKLALAERSVGDLDGAAQRLRDAYFFAGRHGLDRTAALAAANLVTVLGLHAQRVPDADVWVEHARMMEARVDDPDVRIVFLRALGGLQYERGEYEAALSTLREGLALSEQIHGDEHPELGAQLIVIASALTGKGDREAARAELLRARELLTRTLGEQHPWVATSIHNLANEASRDGDYHAALELHQEALAMRRITIGDHLDTAASLDGIGGAIGMLGRFEEAREYFRQALAIMERLLGPDHPRLLGTLLNIGLTISAEDRPEEALPYFERACKLLDEPEPGAERPQHAKCHDHLGDAYYGMHRHAEAEAAWKKALAIRERTGPKNLDTGLTLINLGLATAEQGRPEEALARFERASEIIEGAGGREHPHAARARTLAEKMRQQSRGSRSTRATAPGRVP